MNFFFSSPGPSPSPSPSPTSGATFGGGGGGGGVGGVTYDTHHIKLHISSDFHLTRYHNLEDA